MGSVIVSGIWNFSNDDIFVSSRNAWRSMLTNCDAVGECLVQMAGRFCVQIGVQTESLGFLGSGSCRDNVVVDWVAFNLDILEPGINFLVLVPWDRTAAPATIENQCVSRKIKAFYISVSPLSYEFLYPASQIPSSIREGSVG